MANVEAWAFRKDEKEERARREARFKEMQGLYPDLCIVKRSAVKYGRHEYSGEVPEGIELSDLDIALICDEGNTCFGGVVNRRGRSFTCTIWTD